MVSIHPLQAYRNSEGLSRAELSKKLGVTVTTVGRWENGKRGVRKTLLPKIEEKFGIAAEQILRFETGAAQ